MLTHASFTLWRKSRLLVLVLALFAGLVPGRADDNAVLEEMKSRLLVLQRGIISSEDPAEILRLQKQVRTVMEETLPKLSKEAQPLFAVSMRVVQPLQSLTEDYMRRVERFSTSAQADPTTLKSAAEADERNAELEKLIAHNEEVLVRLNSFEADCERELTARGITGDMRTGFLAGMQKGMGRQIGPMRAIRTLDTQAYRQMQAIFSYLKQHWGRWKPATEGLTWEDPKLEEGFAPLLITLQQTIDRQANAQEVLLQRMQGQ